MQQEAVKKLKRVKIDTYREVIAFLHKEQTTGPSLGLHPLDRVELGWEGKKILAVLNLTEEPFLNKHEVGLSEYGFLQFGVPEGAEVEIHPAPPPSSLELIKKKVYGNPLTPTEYMKIIQDIVAGRYSKAELAAFVTACSVHRLPDGEVVALAEAMVQTGEVLDFHEDLVVDKHSIGGVPGNRTTLILVPIIAAYGLPIPKTSSRAITSPAGTADTAEALANVDLPLQTIYEIVQQERGCFVWGGALKLAPADDIIISVERPLSLDCEGQMIASILSKKKAAGSTHILIDIPVGPGTKVEQMDHAQHLLTRFENIGVQLGLHVKVILTDGSQPIGNGIGPGLEARDVLKVLQNDPNAPQDLKEKSILLAAEILTFTEGLDLWEAKKTTRRILESGEALAKMERIRALQGSRILPKLSPHHHDVCASHSGVITAIGNREIARVARLAGAPKNKRAGVLLFKKVGAQIEVREPLFRIYASNPTTLKFASQFWEEHKAAIQVSS